MRPIAFLFLLVALPAAGQQRLRHSTYQFGNLWQEETVTIPANTPLDLAFYQKHFYRPFEVPAPFVNRRYRNEEVVRWNDTTRPQNLSNNWQYRYRYDARSRVSDYWYSGCLACNQQAFHTRIAYDAQDRPVALYIDHSVNAGAKPEKVYRLRYDARGNLVELRYVTDGVLAEWIRRE